jgi:iron complex transport system ATP-binding protein
VSSSEPVLVANGLELGWGVRRGKPVRKLAGPMSLQVKAGELVCLLGPNGVGKSTLLRTLAGLQRPLRGTVEIRGEDLRRMPAARRSRCLGMVLTERSSGIDALSVRQVVALGRHPHTGWLGHLERRDREAVERALRDSGSMALAERRIGELSDGERQKVMIARALAQSPSLLLLDEPTAFLDLGHRMEVMERLRRLARERGRAVVLSTHDLDSALRAADRLWLFPEGGQLRCGAPEDLVLAGELEALFAHRDLEFDAARGGFRSRLAGREPIGVVGSGLVHTWTLHALERAGYTPVVPRPGRRPEVTIEVTGTSARPLWRIDTQAGTAARESLAEVLAHLAGRE